MKYEVLSRKNREDILVKKKKLKKTDFKNITKNIET